MLCLPEIRKAVCKWGWIRFYARHTSGFVLGDTRAFFSTSSVGLRVNCETVLAHCEQGPGAIPQHEGSSMQSRAATIQVSFSPPTQGHQLHYH